MDVGLIMFGILFVLLFTGMPIAVALGTVGLSALLLLDTNLLHGAGSVLWNNSTSFEIAAAPLFILMGEIMLGSGVSKRFYRAISIWVRWLPGGLLQTNISACSIFAAISGSSVATAATMGTVAIPEMLKRGYDKKVIYGSLAAGGTLGILIPPSIAMIIYGSMVQESIGRLFVGGIIPGLIMAFLFALYIGLRSVFNPGIAPKSQSKPDVREMIGSLLDLLPVVIILLAILAGIYLGWATPTEIAAVGVVMSLVVSASYKGLSWNTLKRGLVSTVNLTSMLLFVIISAQLFSYALFSWGATREIANWVVQLPLHPLGIWAMVALLYIFLGMFIDAISMMVLTVSVVHPIIVDLGMDPIWFGVTLVLLLEVGLITPPVGLNLYTIQAVGRESSIRSVVEGALPFAALLIIGVLILSLFPQLVLWLPDKMF